MAGNRTIEADIVWDGGTSFVARTDSHHFLTIDTPESEGGANTGPQPMEMVACALGGCTAMDVIAILQQNQKTVDSLNVQVTGHRRSGPPAPFEDIHLDYHISGSGLTDDDVRQAIEQSLEKHCSVIEMLRPHVKIVPKWTLERSA